MAAGRAIRRPSVVPSLTVPAYGFPQPYGYRPVKVCPFRTRFLGGSEIFYVNRDIAAKLSIEIARHPPAASVSEGEPSLAVQPGHGRQIRTDRFQPDGPAGQAEQVDPIRQGNPDDSARLAADNHFTHHCP